MKISLQNKLRWSIWKRLNRYVVTLVTEGKVHAGDIYVIKAWRHFSKKLERKNIIERQPELTHKLMELCSIHKNIERELFKLKSEHLVLISARMDTLQNKMNMSENLYLGMQSSLSALQQEVKALNPVKPTPPATQHVVTEIPPKLTDDVARPTFKQLIATKGFYYSGSSALIGFFNEFDNITVNGFKDNIYSKDKSSEDSEISFFTNGNGIFNIVNAFKSNNVLIADIAIKKFIDFIYFCYDNKRTNPWHKSDVFYNEHFFNISMKLFYRIVDIDGETHEFMKDKRYPSVYNSENCEFENCSFMRGSGIGRYIFYRFKNIHQSVFDTYIQEYI